MTLQNTETTSDKLDFKKLLPILMIVGVDLLGLTIIIPLLPLYARSFNADAFAIGVLATAYPAMQLIGAPILGRLSDRYGRKPVLVASQIGTFIGFILLGFANSMFLLMLARVIDGLSGANISTAQAAVADSTTEKNRTQALGLLGAAFGVGFIIGPIIAFISLGLSGNNYHVPALIAAGFSALSILLTVIFLKETHEPGTRTANERAFSRQDFIQTLTSPAVGFLLILTFLQQVAFSGFEQFLALFTLTRLGLNAAGNVIIFIWVGLLVVAVQAYFIRKWSDAYGDRKVILGGLGLLAVGLALTALTPMQPPPWYSKAALEKEINAGEVTIGDTTGIQANSISLPPDTDKGAAGIIWLLIAMIPAAIGGGVLQPTVNSMITKRVDKSRTGVTLGIAAAIISASSVVSPLLMGAIFQLFGNSAPFLFAAVLMAGLLGLALIRLKAAPESSAVLAS